MIEIKEVYLDTHAVIWLENGELHKFREASRYYLSHFPLKISPMVKLELQYLFEIRRLREPADVLIQKIMDKAALSVCDKNWLDVVEMAQRCTFTRDVFDRLIVAHAMLGDSILITKDERLSQHYSRCVW